MSLSNFFKKVTVAAGLTSAATLSGAFEAQAFDQRAMRNLAIGIGVGAIVGGLTAGSRGAYANPPSYGRNRNRDNNADCTPKFANGRFKTDVRCRNQYNSYSAPNAFQPNFAQPVQPRRNYGGYGNQQRQCVQGNYVVDCRTIPGRQFR